MNPQQQKAMMMTMLVLTIAAFSTTAILTLSLSHQVLAYRSDDCSQANQGQQAAGGKSDGRAEFDSAASGLFVLVVC